MLQVLHGLFAGSLLKSFCLDNYTVGILCSGPAKIT